ncbi:MAG: hypothetical protein HZA91_10065 [Verrucomicrobia bacterium]|nr:hypothetical protein [Verrucomicrobiota bacterium]
MSFKDLAKSQPAVAAVLQRSLENERLAHAYLFAGDALEDMALAARELAKAVNCESATKQGGCGQCAQCQKIEATSPPGGQHPDVQWAFAESKSRRIRIKQMRELERLLHQKPGMGRMKVGVVFEADRLVPDAANAFLKTLEEPPDRSLILLLTAQPEQLLETVQSRGQRIQFGAAEAKVNAAHTAVLDGLMTLLDESGSVLAAYRLLGVVRGFLDAERKRIEPEVEARMQLDRYREVEDEDWHVKMEEERLAQVEADYRRVRGGLMVSMEWLLRDVLVCAQEADEKLVFHRDRRDALAPLGRKVGLERAMDNVAVIEEVQEQLDHNVNESLALEVALLRMCGLSAPAPVVT